MLRQADRDNNLVLVLTPEEAYGLHVLVGYSVQAMEIYGYAEYDFDLAALLQTSLLALPDKVILDAIVSPHVDHPSDDVTKMRKRYVEILRKVREVSGAAGLAP